MSSAPRHRAGLRWVALGSTVLFVAAGFGIGTTAAAWVDSARFTATATASTFDIWGRFAADANWEDVGLPGDPDTILVPIDVATYDDVLPGHSYFGDVFLCNAGNVDGVISSATLIEVLPPQVARQLVVEGSIEVDRIDIGTVIPANSCPADPDVRGVPSDPPNDVEGVIHFTTQDEFTDQYGDTTTISITIAVDSQ